jgi:hypothetical protein
MVNGDFMERDRRNIVLQTDTGVSILDDPEHRWNEGCVSALAGGFSGGMALFCTALLFRSFLCPLNHGEA